MGCWEGWRSIQAPNIYCSLEMHVLWNALCARTPITVCVIKSGTAWLTEKKCNRTQRVSVADLPLQERKQNMENQQQQRSNHVALRSSEVRQTQRQLPCLPYPLSNPGWASLSRPHFIIWKGLPQAHITCLPLSLTYAHLKCKGVFPSSRVPSRAISRFCCPCRRSRNCR